MDSQLPPPQNGAREHALPRVDLSPIRPDYSSDLFNRDILTGKVNKDGVTVGKMSETAVELVAPVVAGKVFAPATPLQNLGLPKTTVVQIQAEKQAVNLLTQAGKSEPTITANLTKVAEQNGGKLIELENRFKSQESLTRKIADRTLQNADKLVEKGVPRNQAIQKAMQTQVEDTNDALRYTVTLSKEKYTENVNQTLAALQKQGYKVEHTYDGWKLKGTPNDSGYRGLNVTLKSTNGQVFESQFHTPESFANKTAGHVLYEEARSPLTSPTRKEQIRQIQVKEAERIPTPTDIDQLPSARRPRKGVKIQ